MKKLQPIILHLPYLLILWLVSLTIYLYTKAPSILYIDAGTIVTAAFEPGIPNPPGFPFYVMVAHLFTKIPWETVLFRVQLLSILSALTTLTLLYCNIYRLITIDFAWYRFPKWEFQKARPLPNMIVQIISLTSAFILGFSYQFWSQTLNTESYIFTNMLMLSLLTIVLTLPVGIKKVNSSRLIFAAVLFGLSTGANPTIVQLVPAIAITAVLFWKTVGIPKAIMAAVIAALFMAAVYAYLPVRAMQYPFLNWGNPQTPALFWGHLTGAGLDINDPRTNSVNGFTGSPKVFAQSSGRYIYLLFMQFTAVLLPLVFLGGYYLYMKNKYLLLLLITIPVMNWLFGSLYLSGNQESWFIASYVIFSILIGIGMSSVLKLILANNFTRLKIRTKLAYVIPVVLMLIPVGWWFNKLNRHNHIVTSEYAENLYANIKPNAVLIGSGDFFNSVTHYEYGVLKRRTDVFPVVANMWYILPWYRATLRHHRPDLMPLELETMIKKDRLEEYNEVMNWYIRYLVDKGVAVYVTPMVFRESVLAGTDAGKYIPDKTKLKFVNSGLTFRMLTDKDLLQPDEEHIRYQFKDLFFYTRPPFYLERNYLAGLNLILREYGSSYAAMGDYFLGIGNKEKELVYLKKAYEIAPFSVEIVNRMGIYAVSINDIDAANRFFKQAADNDPRSFEVKLNLGRSYLALNRLDEAAKQFQLIIEGTDNPSVKQEAYDELARINLQNIAAQVPADWKVYKNEIQKFTFKYPPNWQLSTQGQIATLTAPDEFTVSLYGAKLANEADLAKWRNNSSPLKFGGQKGQEGKAQIPGFNADAAYWTDDKGLKVLEFILVSELVDKDGVKRVLHMKIRPSDSPSMQSLDQILSTITFL